MGFLFVELLVMGFLSIVLTVVGLFFGNIILFESIAIGLGAGFVSHGLFHVHPALAIVIGLVTFLVLFFLQNTTVGFWIIGGLMSLLWGFVFSMMAYDYFNKDMTWTYVVLALGTIIMMGLHWHAKEA